MNTMIDKILLFPYWFSLNLMLFMKDIPLGVSINEAVELAKKYSTTDDAAYINGVLGTVSKTIK